MASSPASEKRLVAQPRQNPALDNQRAGFVLGLVARPAHACRQHSQPVVLVVLVVLGKALVRGIGIRLVAVCAVHAGLRLIRRTDTPDADRRSTSRILRMDTSLWASLLRPEQAVSVPDRVDPRHSIDRGPLSLGMEGRLGSESMAD